jgi:UDP-N-acetylglucosamine acyltransferase
LIHPTAVIDSAAELDESVMVGPYAVIGPDVVIGAGTIVESHVVIKGPAAIGVDNHIYQFASIGDVPQDKKYSGESTRLQIGDRNTIREYCTINRGTVLDEGMTIVGSDNWIMAYAHIAHDCVIGSHTIFANNASVAGHVHIGDYAILGGFSAVHQFCHIGEHAFTSMFTYVTKDLPAYVVASGRPAEPRGINTEGLKRRGFDAESIRRIRDAYRIVFRKGLKLEDAIAELESRSAAASEIERFLRSLRSGSRGLMR